MHEILYIFKSNIDRLVKDFQNYKVELDSLIDASNTDRLAENLKNFKVELDNLIDSTKNNIENLIFKCPFCSGDGFHNDWCPWLTNWVESEPDNASKLKFTCTSCHDSHRYFTLKHENDCNFKYSYTLEHQLTSIR